MTRWVLLVTFAAATHDVDVDRWLRRAGELPDRCGEVLDSSVDRHLPGSVGGGDAAWDLRTRGDEVEEAPAAAELLAHPVRDTIRLALDPIAAEVRGAAAGARIKRTLALAVRPGTPADVVQRFERSLQAMPEHIPEIRSWCLSRVRAGRSTPPWTHVWEQEFDDVEALRGPYLHHAYHWSGVDRWFDPEVPCAIVAPSLAHVFRHATGPVLTDAS